MIGVLERLALWHLRRIKQRSLAGEDAQTPIRLLAEYQQTYGQDPAALDALVAELLDHQPGDLAQPSSITSDEYRAFRAELDSHNKEFEGRPYQLGALDAEIDLAVRLVEQFDSPSVLEIGVANGYSSACLYYALNRTGGSIVSLDMPRFHRPPRHPNGRMLAWLARRGRIQRTGTLGDLAPGGVIPRDKHAGWLVPIDLRLAVRNTTFYGNAFNVLPALPDETRFDVAVFDAMKPYDQRMRMFALIDERLRDGGVCVVDGYWANAAFADFAKQHHYPTLQAGRLGVFRKVAKGE